MSQSERTLLVTGLYTLTPTHCGTGQAAGAVDLPIAREAHTGLPLLPASSIKGIARDDWFDPEDDDLYEKLVTPLFGPRPPRRRRPGERKGDGGDESEADREEREQSLSAGDLVFLDGLLLGFPVRSLTGGFRIVTSPLLLHRLRRLAQAHGVSLDPAFACPEPAAEDETLLLTGVSGPLSLEDLVFSAERCREDAAVTTLAGALGRLVACGENDADRAALPKRLVVVADAVLQDLTRRATPVAARIVLLKNKTSDNLWYEEALPPDCLFAVVIAKRPGARNDPLGRLTNYISQRWQERYTQIGGNASVGGGQCRWVFAPGPEVVS